MVVLLAVMVASACSATASVKSFGPSDEPSTPIAQPSAAHSHEPRPPLETPTPPPTPATSYDPNTVPSASPDIAPSAFLECEDITAGDVDYGPNPSGGLPDLEAATRQVRGVRWSDAVAVDASTSRVVREGRTIFVGQWFQSSSGGWLIGDYSSCMSEQVSITTPVGLERDSIADVVTAGLRVRGLPSTSDESVKFDRLLAEDDRVLIVDGPVAGDGYDWYLVQAMLDGSEPGPFGWVAASSRDGEPWIEYRAGAACPTLPGDAPRLGVLPSELLLHCFGPNELSFELDASVYCLEADARNVLPTWFGGGCGILSGDACGGCGLDIAADPAAVTIPMRDSGRWSVSGHFDDPAAATCHAPVPASGDTVLPWEYGIQLCRRTFVLTSLKRLGNAAD